MKRVFLFWVVVGVWAGIGLALAADLDPALVEQATEKWESTIEELEAQDAKEKDPEDGILFIGSSSIRLWDSIHEDMAPYPAIQRGYGGAKFSDAAVFAERLILPHSFRAMVLFLGNDVRGKADDAEPGQVVEWFLHMANVAWTKLPDAPVFCIEITPTGSRWSVWPEIQKVNAALKKACESDPRLHFIPTASAYLNAEGEPRPELFLEDRLHQTPAGYQLWAAIIKSHLDDVLGGAGK